MIYFNMLPEWWNHEKDVFYRFEIWNSGRTKRYTTQDFHEGILFLISLEKAMLLQILRDPFTDRFNISLLDNCNIVVAECNPFTKPYRAVTSLKAIVRW